MGIDPRSRRLVYSDNPTPWCHKILKRAPRRPRKTNRSPPRDRTPRSAVLARWAHIEHHNPDRRGLDQRLALGASTSRSPMRGIAAARPARVSTSASLPRVDSGLVISAPPWDAAGGVVGRGQGARYLGAPVGRGRRCCRAWPGARHLGAPVGRGRRCCRAWPGGSSSRRPRGTRPEVLSGVAKGLVISAPPWDAAGGVVGRGQGARHLGAPVGRGRRCCRAWPRGARHLGAPVARGAKHGSRLSEHGSRRSKHGSRLSGRGSRRSERGLRRSGYGWRGGAKVGAGWPMGHRNRSECAEVTEFNRYLIRISRI